MIQEIYMNPSQPMSRDPAKGASVGSVSEARDAAASVARNASAQDLKKSKEAGPAVDLVSISEKGASQKTDASQKAPQNGGMLKSFEPAQISSNAISFKRTDNNQMIMLVKDRETDKIIKQYPPEEMQRITRAVEKFMESAQPLADEKKLAGIA
jgi:uncharacterized FlaG/YvyC family protein